MPGAASVHRGWLHWLLSRLPDRPASFVGCSRCIGLALYWARAVLLVSGSGPMARLFRQILSFVSDVTFEYFRLRVQAVPCVGRWALGSWPLAFGVCVGRYSAHRRRSVNVWRRASHH